MTKARIVTGDAKRQSHCTHPSWLIAQPPLQPCIKGPPKTLSVLFMGRCSCRMLRNRLTWMQSRGAD